MKYTIWEESIIPIPNEDGMFLHCSAPLERYDDFESAKKALKKMADSNFVHSKYRAKKLERVTKINDCEYEVVLNLRGTVTEKYYIYPRENKG